MSRWDPMTARNCSARRSMPAKGHRSTFRCNISRDVEARVIVVQPKPAVRSRCSVERWSLCVARQVRCVSTAKPVSRERPARRRARCALSGGVSMRGPSLVAPWPVALRPTRACGHRASMHSSAYPNRRSLASVSRRLRSAVRKRQTACPESVVTRTSAEEPFALEGTVGETCPSCATRHRIAPRMRAGFRGHNRPAASTRSFGTRPVCANDAGRPVATAFEVRDLT